MKTKISGRILTQTLEKQNVVPWTGLIWLRIGIQWRALVNTVMNLSEFRKMLGNS
jgi:hypothetical protein